MNVADEMVEALMTALGHEGVYVGNKTGHRALTAALSAAPVPAIDAEGVELIEIARKSIIDADPEILTDTLWAREDLMKGATVVEVLDHAIAALRGVATDAEPVARAQQGTNSLFRKGCNYAAAPFHLCNKCGHYHTELVASAVAAPPASGDGWLPIESAPKDGEFIGRCGPEYKGFSCFWDGDAFVHYDPDDGQIYYPVKEWMPFPASPAPPTGAAPTASHTAGVTVEFCQAIIAEMGRIIGDLQAELDKGKTP